jgi:ElaB/YqjD/DUF883 family membrane-anchored ribosome-binding protein
MGLASFLKNLFGTAKETANDFATKAESKLEQVKEAATPHIEKAEIAAEETFEKVKEASIPILDKAEIYANDAKETFNLYSDKAEIILGNVIETVKQKATELNKNTKKSAPITIEIIEEKLTIGAATIQDDIKIIKEKTVKEPKEKKSPKAKSTTKSVKKPTVKPIKKEIKETKKPKDSVKKASPKATDKIKKTPKKTDEDAD